MRKAMLATLVSLCAVLTACGGGSKDAASQSAQEVKPEAAPIAVKASQIVKDYDENTVAADEKYKGKKLLVSARISEISTDLFDKPYLVLDGPNPFQRAQMHFDDDAKSVMAGLKKGQQIKAVCVGGGDVAKSPMLKDCRITE